MKRTAKISILIKEDKDGIEFKYDVKPQMHITRFLGLLELIKNRVVKAVEEEELSYIG